MKTDYLDVEIAVLEFDKHRNQNSNYQNSKLVEFKAIKKALSIGVVKKSLCDYCSKPLESTTCNDCIEALESHNH